MVIATGGAVANARNSTLTLMSLVECPWPSTTASMGKLCPTDPGHFGMASPDGLAGAMKGVTRVNVAGEARK